jgi:two-component system, LuxR family, response regulator FixJ
MSKSIGAEAAAAPPIRSPLTESTVAPPLVVHVVDDDEAVRCSLAVLLESFGLATESYPSAEALLAAAPTLAPGCLVIDVRMPGMDGVALQAELAARGVAHPVIVVTAYADVPLAVRVMKAGAVDLIEKPYAVEEIVAAVRAALGRMEDTRQQQLASDAAALRIGTLTPREYEVLGQLLEGRPNKAIAHELGISPRTVEIHRANLMDKLECRSLAEVIRLALAAGIVAGAPAGHEEASRLASS